MGVTFFEGKGALGCGMKEVSTLETVDGDLCAG